MPTKTKKIKTKFKLPKVTKSKTKFDVGSFPLSHYSYSAFVKFSTNPILFKIKYINHDVIDSTHSPAMVLGNAFHKAMEVYYGGTDEAVVVDEAGAIEMALKAGMGFLEAYPDGFITYNTTIPNKQKLFDKLSFAFNSYVKERPWSNGQEIVGVEELIEEKVDIIWRGKKLSLPIPLKCYTDKIIREDGKLKIVDYKTCASFSDPDKIDAKKILQAVQYYFATYAKYGEEPYSMIFEEVKHTKNAKGGKQVQIYEMVFADNEQFFDFYLRFYDDVTRAISGEMVYVPNIDAFFDNEVAIVAYIHRLDVNEERAKQMKADKVENITELLKKKIQNAGNMRRLMKTVEEQFVSGKNLNYAIMNNEDKIKTKLMEFGMMLDFDSKISGSSVDLYRFNPSIGLKMSRIRSFTADVEQVLGVSGIRVLAPIPGTSFIGFEVPREERSFPELPSTGDFNLAIGEDIMGEVYRFDIRTAPHMLVAGATGSGKSVFLSSVIKQLSQIDNCEIHLFDPKQVELAVHASDANVVQHETGVINIYAGLKALVSEMNQRYEKLAQNGVRNIQDYEGEMSYKFVIVDEFGDLTMAKEVINTAEDGEKPVKSRVSKEISDLILILAQKARACGIHIILATQRPSVDIITGTIKANFPTKVAFRMAKAIDSQVLLDTDGAEKLLGKGDLLFSSSEGLQRLQGFNL